MDKASYKYFELLSVTVKQPFYANGVCSKYQIDPQLDFELIPTDECLAILRRLDMVFRPSPQQAGTIILARGTGQNSSGDPILRYPPQAGDKLSFWMVLRNVNALNFDDIPPSYDAGKLFFFSNKQTDGLAVRSDLHLSKSSFGAAADNDLLSCVSDIYRHRHNSPVAIGKAKVKHLLSGVKALPESIVNQAGKADLLFNLTSLPLGRCQLFINGVLQDDFYHLGNITRKPFAVVELALDSALPANYRIVEADRSLSKKRPAYSILLPNRKTRWRYTVHLQPQSPLYLEMAALNAADKADFLNRLNVVSNDTAVTFTRTSTTDTDIIFVSNNHLALQEKYLSSSSPNHNPLSLALKKYIGVMAKEAVVQSNLPYPQVRLIDATAYPDIFSDTFITL